MPIMKIIALLPVKNEEWCLKHCLDSLSFADEILAIDDGSTDSTPEILRAYGCTVIPFDSRAELGWKEHAIRTALLDEARKRGATHVIALDADEACSPEFAKNARGILASLNPGQALEMEWLNLCSHATYKEPRVFKSFAFCDDGTSAHQKAFLGEEGFRRQKRLLLVPRATALSTTSNSSTRHAAHTSRHGT